VYSKGADGHTGVVQAGLRLFERDGDAITLRSVAAEAGLSPAVLRYYLPTRDALMTGLLMSVDQQFETSSTRDGARLGPDELLAVALTKNQRHPVRISLCLTVLAATVDPKHPATQYFRRRLDRWRSMIAGYVRKQQDSGVLPGHVDAEHAARTLLAAAEGIQHQWVADRSIDMGAHFRRVWRAAVS
jgi:AcrR family transcriptional regulator